ncbi:ATP-dependent DNA helicase RecG [Thermaerobacter sp. PB12/4term]|uniref:ATP-dependent DNA helicase RecG n=1 Tax=Thermaerobacter sp. PB12/4term TaxID=2293838 RepID=UPI000E329CFF|nr:ATP-dependent DNA helicase RecG [Thermaerobacter sp. PB12/4term]QIA26897.1 ATP-dependent DNA helicase RecG [Thermaerobacter sp. PB12/4term]
MRAGAGEDMAARREGGPPEPRPHGTPAAAGGAGHGPDPGPAAAGAGRGHARPERLAGAGEQGAARQGTPGSGQPAGAWAELAAALQRAGDLPPMLPAAGAAAEVQRALEAAARTLPPDQRGPLREAYRLFRDFDRLPPGQRAERVARAVDLVARAAAPAAGESPGRRIPLNGELAPAGAPSQGRPLPPGGQPAPSPVAPASGPSAAAGTAPAPAAGAGASAPSGRRSPLAGSGAGEITPATPLGRLPGVGRRQAQRLARLGLHTAGDLLWHLPRRYEDRSTWKPIARLVPGEVATVQGVVVAAQRVPTRTRRAVVRVTVSDGSGRLDAVFFNQPFRLQQLSPGRAVRLSGRVEAGYRGWQMDHPEVELLEGEGDEPVHTARIVPVYPATEGLHQRWLRQLAWQVVGALAGRVPEILPEELRRQLNLVERAQALRDIHFPPDAEAWQAARRRLAFEEWFVMQVALARVRSQQQQEPGRAHRPDGPRVARFLAGLPFELTPAQRRVLDEIRADMEAPRPMRRLVQGDVGSGKTVIAAWAMVKAVESGAQAALMAPTEILAEQHARRLQQLLAPAGIPVVLLVGSQPAADRERVLQGLATGQWPVVVGTHALIQENVRFRDLGLVVIDEQHRFGVRQRALLQDKGRLPDLLVMTATPIPRTLALTLYGDLDVSVIDQLPPGRQPVRTVWLRGRQRRKAYDLLAARVAAGEQGYVVCPLVDDPAAGPDRNPAGASTTGTSGARRDAAGAGGPIGGATGAAPGGPSGNGAASGRPAGHGQGSGGQGPGGEEPAAGPGGAPEDAEHKAVTTWAEYVARRYPRLRVGILHGRMPGPEKERVMRAFERRALDVLVATTVIEVGVDVPNATVMIIEGADRFGLAQLHQLRGRVGRGSKESLCILVADPASAEGQMRLEALCRSQSGFDIAEFDLQLRGPGDFFGTRQHGLPALRIADPVKDAGLLRLAREAARRLLERDPGLDEPAHRPLREEVVARYGDFLAEARALWS